MINIFFYERGKQVLLSLEEGSKYISEVAREINATYAHTFNLVKKMEQLGIVVTEKKGRTKYVKLTPKGMKLAGTMRTFIEVLKKPKSKFKKKEKKKVTTKAKTKKQAGETLTDQRLAAYLDSLVALSNKIESKKLKPKQRAKYLRLVGRYRSLILKLRPRDDASKDLKSEAVALLQDINKALYSY